MKRKYFIQRLFGGAAAIFVAPKVLEGLVSDQSESQSTDLSNEVAPMEGFGRLQEPDPPFWHSQYHIDPKNHTYDAVGYSIFPASEYLTDSNAWYLAK